MTIVDLLNKLDGLLWGTPLIAFAMILGAYYMIRGKFFPFVHFLPVSGTFIQHTVTCIWDTLCLFPYSFHAPRLLLPAVFPAGRKRKNNAEKYAGKNRHPFFPVSTHISFLSRPQP